MKKVWCLPGEEAKILFGTSDKDAHILYELYQDNKCISRKRIVLSNENHLFRIPFMESYGEGVVAQFTFVKDGKLYTSRTDIKRQQPNLSLAIKPITFRDHLLPGNKETWKFRILDADSMPVMAEMLASMYDASLDKILPSGSFRWNFDIEKIFLTCLPPLSTEVSAWMTGQPINQKSRKMSMFRIINMTA